MVTQTLVAQNRKKTAASSNRIRVLVIDDNRLVREVIEALLAEQEDVTVVAATHDTATGLSRLVELTPHIVLVDCRMVNGHTREFVETMRKSAPQAKVVVMDLVPSPEDVIEFVQAGANGFVMKDASVDDLVSTIRSVALGADVVPPSLTGTLLTHIAQQAAMRRLPGVAEAVRMTKREQEIVNLIAEGSSNKEIAQRLSIATYTVKSHVHNILEKLALNSRLQIAAYSRRARTLAAA